MSKVSRLRGGLWAAALLGGVTFAAHAQAPASGADGLPAEKQVGTASVVSGGIAEGESTRFLAAFGRYPLAVQLFERDGSTNAYTADAIVRITDAKGQVVLEEKSNGPFMLVRLPAGEYRVAAELKGRTLPAQKIRVTNAGHAKATFVFPAGTG